MGKVAVKPLDVVERGDFRKAEATIKKHLNGFFELGQALFDIRENKWYRETHKTFEKYCHEKWDFSSSRARQLIGAAETVGGLESVTTVTLSSEAQARELSGLEPEVAKTVIENAAGTGPLTAKSIKEARKEVEAQSPRVCPNCQGTEFDDDGDCTGCYEPPAGADDPPDEPEEPPEWDAAVAKKAKTALGQLLRALASLGVEWEDMTLQEIKDTLEG